jgi:hypothetical protein
MKTLFLSALFSLAMFLSAFGQDRTDETRITVDTETGDTVITESVIVSLTEDITPRGHMFIINPLKFLLFYNISYFQKVSENVVVGGGVQIPTISGLNGFGANAEVRVYPSGENLRGFYMTNLLLVSVSEQIITLEQLQKTMVTLKDTAEPFLL